MPLYGTGSFGSHPLASFGRLRQEMDELFERFGSASGRSTVFPPVNLYEADGAYVLTAELPGVRSEDLEITVEGRSVTLRGERKIEHPADEKLSFHRRERQAGQFRRSIELPVELDADKTEANYRNGVLMLRIAKAPQHQPRHIAVRS